MPRPGVKSAPTHPTANLAYPLAAEAPKQEKNERIPLLADKQLLLVTANGESIFTRPCPSHGG